MTLDRVLSGLGRFFIGAGLIVLLFVAYQLWGTGLAEASGQNDLKNEAASLFTAASQADVGETGDGSTSTTANTTPAPPPAPTGSAVAVMRIPKINLEKAVIEGTAVPDLKKAPGHYEGTPLPGQPGNAAIAGHRTTYGAPFGDVGELVPGDEIDVTTAQGTFVYIVSETKVVKPSDVSVLEDFGDNRLTLTTCHPKFSAAQRLIIIATLRDGAAPAATTTTTAPGSTATTAAPSESTVSSLPGEEGAGDQAVSLENHTELTSSADAKGPAIIWGIVAALVLLAVYILGRTWRRLPAWIIGTPLFLIVLFIFFENFALLLPSSA